jgi:ParB-like nuclease domain/Integrase core domain
LSDCAIRRLNGAGSLRRSDSIRNSCSAGPKIPNYGDAKNTRTHSKKQIRKIATSIRELGFAAPVLVDEYDVLIAGHGRLEAARSLGMASIPAIVLDGLSEAKKRALMLADNRIAQSAGWDREQLSIELAALPELLIEEGIDVGITGFEPAEIDLLHMDFEDGAGDPAEDIPEDCLGGPRVTQIGDLWCLGKHRLLCGDARSSSDLERLLGAERAHMAFLDPPYNVTVRSIVGRGKAKHREFAMASGEMSRDQFTDFLKATLNTAAKISTDGAVHYVCMDWRHVEELVAAGRLVYGAMLNLIAWVKTNAGQGSFYRSQQGDLLSGPNNSYIATLVERHTRYVMLAKVAGKDTRTVVTALIKQAKKLPKELYKSLTWDRGKELTDHRRFTLATKIYVYFCDPQSPWQRGSNENTNGLLRQYFPKGTDLSVHSQAYLNKVARQLNERPRETLQFETPAERFNACVASTG